MSWKPDICVYHGGCPDGFSGAWAVWRRWGSAVIFVPAGYGRTIEWPAILEKKHILFIDFSLKYDAMKELANGGVVGQLPASIVVLDHHKTAEAELAQWNIGTVQCFSLERTADNVAQAVMEQGWPIVAHFDMGKSGARLAWEFCFPGENIPRLLQHVEDRDLWRFELADTHEISAALRTYEQRFFIWESLAQNVDAVRAEGAAILRGHRKNIDEMMRESYEMVIGGHTVPVVNAPYQFASDIANALLEKYPGAPFAACWFQRGDGQRQFSLRSEDSRLDVSEIARQFGGGGHRNAAGFQLLQPDTTAAT